jgi:hypothetical protein
MNTELKIWMDGPSNSNYICCFCTVICTDRSILSMDDIVWYMQQRLVSLTCILTGSSCNSVVSLSDITELDYFVFSWICNFQFHAMDRPGRDTNLFSDTSVAKYKQVINSMHMCVIINVNIRRRCFAIRDVLFGQNEACSARLIRQLFFGSLFLLYTNKYLFKTQWTFCSWFWLLLCSLFQRHVQQGEDCQDEERRDRCEECSWINCVTPRQW